MSQELQLHGQQNSSKGLQAYRGIVGKKYRFLLLFGILCVISVFFDIVTGPAMLALRDVFQAIVAPTQVNAQMLVIVREIRLPIAIMAIGVGASLGLAGAVMQTILNNPLASPYTLGIGAGASFGASLAITTGVGASLFGAYSTSVSAFFFAMLVCLVIYLLGRNGSMPSSTMILAGIALLFIFQSLQALLQYAASEQKVQTIVFWSFGSLQKTTWVELVIVWVVLAVCMGLIMRNAWTYSAMLMGDEKVESFGINVNRVKVLSFVLISLLSAFSVCFVGTIGFVGLVGPHVARLLVGEDQRFYLPVSALCGALLLSVASVISKIVVPGIIFPIGIITSIIGVPFFFALIVRKKKTGGKTLWK